MIAIENLSYDRGYLSSTAQSRIHVVDPGLSAELEHAGYPTDIIVNHEISHGLLSISSVSTFETEANKSDFIKGLKLTTESQLTGTTELLLSSQDANFVNDDLRAQGVEKLFVAASQVSATVQKDGQFTLAYDLPKTELRLDNQSEFVVDNVKGQSVGHYVGDIFIGEANINMDKLVLNDVEGQNHNEVKGFNYTSINQIKEVKDKPEDNALSSSNKLTINEIVTDSGTLENGVFDLSFEELNYDALIKLVPLLQDQEITPEKVQQLMLSFDLLAAKGFKVNLNEFSADVLGSKVNSQILLTLPAGTARASQNADKLVQTLQGSSELVIAKKNW